MLMKYVTEQFVKKIKVDLVCRFDDHELCLENGEALAAYQFDRKYVVDTISMEEGRIIVNLMECPVPEMSSVGEELMATEDWMNEHKERFGVEPNLFDGA